MTYLIIILLINKVIHLEYEFIVRRSNSTRIHYIRHDVNFDVSGVIDDCLNGKFAIITTLGFSVGLSKLSKLVWPLLLTWINFNPSMDK